MPKCSVSLTERQLLRPAQKVSQSSKLPTLRTNGCRLKAKQSSPLDRGLGDGSGRGEFRRCVSRMLVFPERTNTVSPPQARHIRRCRNAREVNSKHQILFQAEDSPASRFLRTQLSRRLPLLRQPSASVSQRHWIP